MVSIGLYRHLERNVDFMGGAAKAVIVEAVIVEGICSVQFFSL